jgi:hypothetical protein
VVDLGKVRGRLSLSLRERERFRTVLESSNTWVALVAFPLSWGRGLG